MSLALFVESATDAGDVQTLIIPARNGASTFTRVSTGARGRGQAWQHGYPMHSDPVTRINAVVLTQRDLDNASVGNVTALAIKAMNNGAAPIDPQPHDTVVASLSDRLIAGDETLANYVTDARRTQPVSIKPVVVTGAPVPQPTPAPQPASQAALITPVFEDAQPVNVVPLHRQAHDLASVPERKWADNYINRKIHGRTDFDIYDIAMSNHENVLIRGHAGSGKTMSVMAYAAARNLPYYNVSSNVGLEPSHLFGSWVPTEAGTFRWQDGPVTSLFRTGGVLLLNEIDFMPERVTTVLFSALDDRREIQLMENGGEIIKAHPNLVIIGDHNPNYRGSRPMNQAWKDRFHHKLEFPYDKAIERKLVPSASLLDLADKLRAMSDKGELDTPISTRGLVAFVSNTTNISFDYAVESYVNGFLDDEREAVRLTFDTYRINIASELGK